MKRTLFSAIVIASALLAGACGSDAVDTATTDQTEPTTAPETTVTTDEETSDESLTRLWIKPDLVDCVGVAEQTCMQIAESEDGEYEYFYDQIDGFTFVAGTSYVIDVRIDEIADPPADGSSLAYTLVKVIEES